MTDPPLTVEMLTPVVTKVVAAVTGVADEQVSADTDLSTLPGFTSLALLRVVDRLEALVGREVPAYALVPDTFETPATVAAALVAASEGRGLR